MESNIANDSIRQLYLTNDTIYLKINYIIERSVVSDVYIFKSEIKLTSNDINNLNWSKLNIKRSSFSTFLKQTYF